MRVRESLSRRSARYISVCSRVPAIRPMVAGFGTSRTGSAGVATIRVPPSSFRRHPNSSRGSCAISCDFCNEDSLPAVAQAAIAHAQFETIHPFVDWNGRTGRALIQMILRKRGLAPRVVPPVSLILATHSKGYIGALGGYRHLGDSATREAMKGTNEWVSMFAGACTRAVSDANGFEERIRALETSWRARLGKVRRGSSTDLLLSTLPGAPVLTVNGASRLLGRSFNAVNGAMTDLLEAGIVRQVTVGKRNRAFESGEVIDAFTDLERQLASPAANTRVSPPARPAPRRTK